MLLSFFVFEIEWISLQDATKYFIKQYLLKKLKNKMANYIKSLFLNGWRKTTSVCGPSSRPSRRERSKML